MAGDRRSLLAPIRALGSALKHEGAYELTRKFWCAVRREGLRSAFDRLRIYKQRLGEERELEVADPAAQRDVLFVSACPGGTRRYRCRHAIESLAHAGLTADMICFPARSPDAWVDSSRAVVLQRVPVDARVRALCAHARERGIRTVFDLDDLLFDANHVLELDAGIFASPFEREWARDHAVRIGEALALCDHVVVSTETLREAVERRFEHANVTVVPNVVSTQMLRDFDKARDERDANSRLRIGFFSGTPTHDDAFASIAPALDRVLSSRPDVELVLTGPVTLPATLAAHESRVVRQPLFAAADYPRALHGVDIHLAPLRDCAFDRAKSALKWLEASLVGRPLVASGHGEYGATIDHDVTGYVCRTQDEWTRTLLLLIDEPLRRSRIGESARAAVRSSWTTAAISDSWGSVLADPVPVTVAR